MVAAKPVSQDGRGEPEVCLDVKTEGSTHLKEALRLLVLFYLSIYVKSDLGMVVNTCDLSS